MAAAPQISVSVVSHDQGNLVATLLSDFASCVNTPCEVMVTLNRNEELPFRPDQFRFPARILRNASPKGFGTNHNAAFREARGEFFCVLNPDIRLSADPFPGLLACLRDPDVGVAAPLIRNPAGAIEDSARRIPTPWVVFRKLFARRIALDYEVSDVPFHPEWVAGMFMLLTRDTYAGVGGFDERYFLYYEDVDLCARVALLGKRVVLNPSVAVVHDARRDSRRSPRHVGWHLSSMLRFFLSSPGSPLLLRRMERKGHQ